jgi:hypothetical protein
MKAEIRKYSETAQAFITKESKKHNGDGEICYPYAFGYSLSETASLLNHLELTAKQIELLKDWTRIISLHTIV